MKDKGEVVKAKEKLSSIIKKYGSLELLRNERNLYQKSINEGNKQAAADSWTVDHLKKKIKSIEERNGVLKDKEESRYKEHCEKCIDNNRRISIAECFERQIQYVS